jgi:hypothetical protein
MNREELERDYNNRCVNAQKCMWFFLYVESVKNRCCEKEMEVVKKKLSQYEKNMYLTGKWKPAFFFNHLNKMLGKNNR